MPLITDPDELLQGAEVTLDTASLEISLNLSGQLSEDGVTLQALYSFLKEEWIEQTNGVHRYPFPMLSITPEQFEIGNNGSTFSDWTWTNDATRSLIRTAGWREYDTTGDITREYLGAITLGNIDATDKVIGDRAYYAFSSDSSSTDFVYAGQVNEGIQIFGNATNGDFDKRAEVLTLYIRQAGKTYGQATTTDIGLSVTTYIASRFPLTETIDLAITADDSVITSEAPYTNMSIQYHELPVPQVIGGTSYDFGITIDGASGSAEQIYEFVQYQLRQAVEIDIDGDSPQQTGNLQDSLLQFVGANLEALQANNADGGGNGVRIVSFDQNDTNRLTFVDNLAENVNFPFISAGAIAFNANIVNDTDARYWLFYEDANGNLINTDNAILVTDTQGNEIEGVVSGESSVAWDFDYDGNTDGGRTAGTDANFVLRVIGLNTAQFAEVRGTINRSTGQVISITSALERNYVNA